MAESGGTETIRKVFVVDDDSLIVDTLTLILRREGYDIVGFVNPLDALHAAETFTPDLLISDVMMPQLSGVELAIHFRRQWPRCKILLFSANAETEDLLANARRDQHDFVLVAKPLHPAYLLQYIDRLSRRSSAVAEELE